MPNPQTAPTIKAVVKHTHDPDIPIGAEVTVTGYVAVVPRLKRQAAIGAPTEQKDVTVSFGLGELELQGNVDDEAEAALKRFASAAGEPLPDRNPIHDEIYSSNCKPEVEVERLSRKIGDLKGAVIEALGGKRGVMSWSDALELCRKIATRRKHYTPDETTPPGTARWVVENITAILTSEVGDLNVAMMDAELWLNSDTVRRALAPTSPAAAPDAAELLTPPIGPRPRLKLPDTRPSVTHRFDIAGLKGYITLGFYDEQCEQPGEIFIVMQKQGSTLQGVMDAWARSLSMMLQYGIPVAELARMFAWHKFEPRGMTTNEDIKYANSVVDYVARWLGYMCVEGYTAGGDPTAIVP